MLGDKAADLVKELYRIKRLLPAYDDVLLKQIFDEMEALAEQNSRDLTLSLNETNDRLSAGIYFRHIALERNKQSILAYLYHRLRRIERSSWVLGAVVPEEMRNNMSLAERNFLVKYNMMVSNYGSEVGGVDLGIDLNQSVVPPQDVTAEVRVLKDYGEFETEMGDSVLLKKDTNHSLPLSDCEMLARQGVISYSSEK